MTIPTRYRELLQSACQGRVVITRDHRSPCLLVYPQPTWEAIERQLSELPNLDESSRELQRRLIGFATDCEMDGHGRILLPPTLRDFAGLDKRVMLIGQVNKFELWDEQTWNGHCNAPLAGPRGDSRISEFLSTLSL